ncbi:ABC transporter permease [Helicobacter suis]|uniref:ABC transporter permease n=1 Tax=Helicobacter suis TaxID=104628 RepID=UPI0013D84AD0|nr:ABC transporter permease [Helicobacter suis]
MAFLKKTFLFGALLIVGLTLLPLCAPFAPTQINLTQLKLPPSFTHLLGTDFLGRDEFSRLLFALRNSIYIGLLSALGAMCLALGFAFVSLNAPKWLASLLLRFLDGFLALPNLLLILLFSAFNQRGFNLLGLSLLVAFFAWGSAGKLIHDSFSNISTQEFILNEKALGATRLALMFIQILPVAKNSVFVLFINICAHAISTEALLSFFGLGLRVGEASLGNMLNEASEAIFTGTWWLLLTPGLAVFIIVFGLMLLGEKIQEDG